MTAQGAALGYRSHSIHSPKGAALTKPDYAFTDQNRINLGPPRWGFPMLVVTVTQGCALGFHGIAPLGLVLLGLFRDFSPNGAAL